jgi:integrase
MPGLVNKKRKNIVVEGVCTIRHIAKNDKWEVDAGLKLGGSKKYRKRFKSLSDAQLHSEQLKIRLRNQGIGAFRLTEAQQVDAQQALKALKKTKFSTLLQAVEFAQRYAGEHLTDMTVSELVQLFREMKETERKQDLRGASEATLLEYKYRHGLLENHFGEILVREFTEAHFKPLFESKNFSPNLLNKTKTLFNFAVKKGLIPENPIKLEQPKKKVSAPRIFEDIEWKLLVQTAIRSQDHRFSKGEPVDLLAYIVLGLWCGLRPKAELERLQWADIDIGSDEPSVFIHEEWKVRQSRRVDIPECAVHLLKKCKNQTGLIANPKNLRRRLDWLKQEAKVASCWAPDIMRHTFASMHYGLNNDKNAIANQLGHVGQNVLSHYINNGIKMKDRAKDFFSFNPESNG